MARTCTVCHHEDRDAIDHALVAGATLRDLARRHGVSKDALHRHKQDHVSEALARVHRRREVAHAESLLDRIESLYEAAQGVLEAAEQDGKAGLSLQAIRELRGIVELLGKATGELRDSPQVTVNVLTSSEWIAIRAALFAALAPYAEARAAVAGKLLELES